MPRTVEHIVHCHQLSQARCNAGLPIWDKTISIKHILQRDQSNESNEHAAAVANEIATVLKSRLPAKMLDIKNDEFDEVLADIVEGMESLKADSYADDPTFSPLQDLNGMLEGLYDWADENRVWIA